MRGRTNITQRAVPYVNGDVITAEVEIGSVNTGDFVEYKTITQEQEINKIYNVVDERDTEHYKFVLCRESYGARLECHNKSDFSLRCYINFTSTTSSPSICFDVIDESNFLFAINYYVQGNYASHVLYLTIENDDFVIKDTVATSGSLVAISHISSNTFVGSATGASGTSHSVYLRVGEYDYTNKTITYLGTKEIDNIMYYGSQYYSYFLPISENKFIYFTNLGTNSSTNGYVYAHLMQYNPSTSFSNASFTIIQKAQVNSSMPNTYCKFLIISNNLVYIMHDYSGSGSGFAPAICIMKYDSVNGTISAVVNNYMPYTIGYWYYQKNVSLVSDKKILVERKVQSDQYYKVCVITFDDENNELLFSNDLLLEESNYILLKFCIFDNSDNLKVYYQGQSNEAINHIQSLIYLTNTLSKSVDKNYVKQYSGGNAIGFAKTSGNVGQNVNIYVPHQS